MTVSGDRIQKAMLAKGYVWYADRPNLVGVRASMDVPNVFNDLLCVSWVQSRMPEGLTVAEAQRWLNRNMFVGRTGGKLAEDGKSGGDTQFALSTYNGLIGRRRDKFYQLTTDPGVYWLEHPMNAQGTAVLKPGQYKDCWSLGYHRGQQDHPALVQTSPVTVYRDGNKNQLHDDISNTDTGLFGINIHGASPNGVSTTIDRWSAGCNVFSSRRNLFDVLALLNLYKGLTGNKFTYTLLLESELG